MKFYCIMGGYRGGSPYVFSNENWPGVDAIKARPDPFVSETFSYLMAVHSAISSFECLRHHSISAVIGEMGTFEWCCISWRRVTTVKRRPGYKRVWLVRSDSNWEAVYVIHDDVWKWSPIPELLSVAAGEEDGTLSSQIDAHLTNDRAAVFCYHSFRRIVCKLEPNVAVGIDFKEV